MEFLLRDFRPGDFESLWAIDQACFSAGIAYSRIELNTYIRLKNSFTVVAECRSAPPERISGFIVGESHRGKGHIITIDVLPEFRRSGLGSKLLTTAEQRLLAVGCERVHLETAVDNQAAIAFYKRHKYFIQKTTPGYYSNGVDAFVMVKALAETRKESL